MNTDRSCTTCVRADKPISDPVCAPCWSAGGGARPQWKPWPQPVIAPVTDTQRLDWLLPLVTVLDDPNNLGGPRTKALAAALVLGKSGRDAIDYAMEGSP
jgi:hypothetical protein